MIIKTLLSTSVILLLASPAIADVPHTFQANTPAKASEVNDNFADLDARVGAIENLEESTCPQPSNSSHVIATYTPIEANLGDRIRILEKEFIIAKFPFIVPSSGERYGITLPVSFGDNNGVISLYSNFTAITGQALDNCSDLYISGFQAALSPITVGNSDSHPYILNSRASGIANNSLIDTVKYYYSADVIEDSPGSTMLSASISRNVNMNLNIAIEDAVLGIKFQFGFPAGTSEDLCEDSANCEVEPSGYDFTVPTATMALPSTNASLGLDTWIDYIKIEKMD